MLLQLDEQQFWNLMTTCPGVRKAVLGNMAYRFQKFQSSMVQQEKMAALGTLAAGLMHELNNPGAAAVRAASQLRDNLLRMHRLTAKFSKAHLSDEQKACMFELQEYALAKAKPVQMNSLEQSDAEESLAEWMEGADVEDAWKIAPTLVSIGIDSDELDVCAQRVPRAVFLGCAELAGGAGVEHAPGVHDRRVDRAHLGAGEGCEDAMRMRARARSRRWM